MAESDASSLCRNCLAIFAVLVTGVLIWGTRTTESPEEVYLTRGIVSPYELGNRRATGSPFSSIGSSGPSVDDVSRWGWKIAKFSTKHLGADSDYPDGYDTLITVTFERTNWSAWWHNRFGPDTP